MKSFRLSFRTKTVLVLLFFGLSSLLLSGLFILSHLEDSLQKKTLQNLEEINKLVATQIENFITEAFNEALFISQNPIFISPEVSFEEKGAEVKRIANYYPIFHDITLLDKDGRILSSSSFKFYGKWARNFWFLEAKEKKKIVMSDIYAVTDPSQPILSFFIPFYDQKGEINFFLALQINMERFLEIISSVKIGQKGGAFLINSRGDIIAHSQKSLLFEKISSNYPLKEANFLKKGKVEFTFGQEKMLGIFKVIENFQHYPGKNWHLILAQPKEEILHPIREIRSQIYLFLFFFSFGIILIASFLSEYITRPLRKFIIATSKIAAGNFQVEVDIQNKDEFGNLAVTFNKMASDLQKSYLLLQESKQNLEKQVKARTEELEILAKNLDAEVKKRTKELQKKIKELGDSRTALLNILEDVEEGRRKAEEERDKTNILIANFADGLLFFDKENKLSLINPQAENFFDLKAEELMGRSISELKNYPNIRSIIDLLGGEIKRIFRQELPLKKDLILEVSVIPIVREGENFGHLVILHDITREKMVERIKTEFVSLSAHQLRTPLSAIKWTLKMFLDGDLGELSQEQKAFIEKTYFANERMINLINDLLNVARIEEGRYLYKPTFTDIGLIFHSVLDFYKEKALRKKIEITLKSPKTLPKIKIDKEKIELAISNLINNAIEYTPSGGKIEIRLKSSEKEIECSISDTGIGIPKDQQRRVFEKFFRAANAIRMQTDGTGLGLFITKNIIEAHQGKIWFESEEGKGTTFYFTLPIEKEVRENE